MLTEAGSQSKMVRADRASCLLPRAPFNSALGHRGNSDGAWRGLKEGQQEGCSSCPLCPPLRPPPFVSSQLGFFKSAKHRREPGPTPKALE
jgi:hypothetical protein